MVELKKKTSCKIEVRLGDSVQSGEPSDNAENPETNTDILSKIKENQIEQQARPTLLRDILGAIQRQNPENWRDVQKEIVDVINEELPQ